MKKRLVACLVLPVMVAMALQAPAQMIQRATTAPATQPVDPKWAALLSQLGDNDFAKREAAQAELEKITWHDLAILKTLAKDAGDAEVTSRLLARIGEIEKAAALDPLPLTVELDNGPLDEVCRQLSAAMGVQIEAWPPGFNGNNENTFTLHAKEKPFWIILKQLNVQHAVTFQPYGDRVQMQTQSGGVPTRNLVIEGPLAVMPMSITRSKRSDLQAVAGKGIGAEQLQLDCQLMLDPRIKVVSYHQPTFASVVDENGTNLLQPQGRNGDTVIRSARNQQYSNQGLSTGLLNPPNIGKVIASAKGSFTFEASIGEEVMVVDAADTKVGQTIQVGQTSIKLAKFTVGDSSIDALLERPTVPGLRRVAGGPQEIPVTAEVFDANGKKLWTMILSGGGSGGTMSGPAMVKPIKIKFTMPSKTKETTIPFELKDLPLP